MKKIPSVLYAVTEMTYSGALIRPKHYSVVGSGKRVFRVPLGQTVEDALLFTYPNLYRDNFLSKKFTVWEIEPTKRHGVIKPKYLHQFYEFPYADKLEEFASMRNLRMVKSHNITVCKTHENNDIVTITEGEKEIKLGVRFFPIITV